MTSIHEIEFASDLIGILYERTNAESNLLDAVTRTERKYWRGAVDSFDLVIKIMTGHQSNEVYEELDRRNGYYVS